jgi:hypothetical protein
MQLGHFIEIASMIIPFRLLGGGLNVAVILGRLEASYLIPKYEGQMP